MSGDRRIPAGEVAAWLRDFAGAVAEAKDELTRLDAAIGDADHGINMDRGMRAVLDKLDAEEPGDVPGLMRAVGMALISKVGGAAGPLYGTFFLQFGSAAGTSPLSPEGWVACFEAGVAGVRSRGKAEPEDKTMVDALMPAAAAMRAALADGASFPEVLARGADGAEEGTRATIPLVARKGRASYLGERSAGHQDPGATSSALLVRCAARTWAAEIDGSE
ncbi:dihydroxyacetone kinase subunit DhaL [Miltoncostaea oceani]|jgi:phosphoenolpyruvate---glycerone phosphotransferase subunit DhaL|uniref:dihydroxyacetone kinase subunit DhaL n=1 Tax=Miltoncostaea oceani TaxID=2843216 RepID=UPI001C3C5770|nr:dihydroxyacetone kinase subunit DhaL [Miltoncostaea oceani]